MNFITGNTFETSGHTEGFSVETGLNGKSFCVTGSFESISRDEIHTFIEQNDGEVRTSVSPKLNYLIVGSDAGSKKAKAEELGVKILDLEELYELVGE